MSMKTSFQLGLLTAQDASLKSDRSVQAGGQQLCSARSHQKPPGRWGRSRKVEGPAVPQAGAGQLQDLSEAKALGLGAQVPVHA